MKGDRVFVFIEPITESGWYHGVRKPSSLAKGEGFLFSQDAENGAQLRSRLARRPQRTPRGYASGACVACGLVVRHFEHPLC